MSPPADEAPLRPRACVALDPRRLEHALGESIARHQEERGPACRSRRFVVAPTHRLLDHLERRLTLRFGALSGVHFLVHRGLAEQIRRTAGRPPLGKLPDPFLEPLLRARLRSVRAPFGTYLQEQPSALGPLLATLRDLRDAGLRSTSREISAELHRGAALSAIARATLECLAVHEGLLAELAPHGFADGAAIVTEARDLVESAPAPACDRLLHYGAYDLIGVHRELLRAVARRAPVELFVPAEPGAHPAQELLESLRAEVCTAPTGVALCTSPEPPTAITFAHAAGPREELRHALRRLLSWHLRDAVPFAEMAILVRAPAPYATALWQEAELLGLVPDTSVARPLGLEPAALALVQRLERASRAGRGHAPLSERITELRALAGGANEPALDTLLGESAWNAGRLESAGLAGPWQDPATAADATATLVRGLVDAASASPVADAPHRVRLLDFQQARGLPLRRAIWIGCNEQFLPRRAAEDFFLPDADRIWLRKATGLPVPLRAHAKSEEELLFAVLRAGVSEQLEVTWARSFGDRDAAPSPWLRRLHEDAEARARLLPRHPAREIEVLRATTGLLRMEEAALAAAQSDPRSAEAIVGALRPAALADFARSLAMVDRIDRYAATAPGDLAFDGGGIAIAARDTWSPTALQSLGRCPLQYLFAHELGLAAPVEVEPGELDRRTLGSLFHRVLRQLYEVIVPPGRMAVADALEQARARVPELVAAALRAEDPKGTLLPALVPLRCRQWSRELLAFVAADLARIREQQLAGGGYEQAEVAELTVAGAPLPLRLRFDRILRDGGGREWIGDYKLKDVAALAPRVGLARALAATELQLPLYWLARKAAGADVAAAEFLALEAGRSGGDGDDRDDRHVGLRLDRFVPAAPPIEAMLQTLLALRNQGTFPLQPELEKNHGQCSRCDFRRACRHTHGPTQERVRSVAAHAAYFALKGHQA